jgi:cation:H+ antiporter
MDLVPILLVCAGLAILAVSADEAIKRVLNLARYFRLSEFSTSFLIAGVIAVLPELTIGVVAALEGTSSLGFGVILGSNIADLTLVIGLAVLFAGKLKLEPNTVRQIRNSFLAVILPLFLFLDGDISRVDGAILLLAFAVCFLILLRSGRNGRIVADGGGKKRFTFEVILLVASLAVLFFGGNLVAHNSQELSLQLGLPLFLVGVIVAVGTCFPEMPFAIRASRRGHGELGLGNVLGCVLADSLFTIGVVALIQPIKPMYPTFPLSTAVFLVLSAIILYGLSRDGVLDRRDGAILVAAYGVFLAMQLVLRAFNI